MPELPEVEGVVRALAPIATGKTIMKSNCFGYGHKSKKMGKKQLSKE